jgi:hypothetical protein
MRLDKRVKDLFRYVGLRSQSLADPPLRYRAPLGAKSRIFVVDANEEGCRSDRRAVVPNGFAAKTADAIRTPHPSRAVNVTLVVTASCRAFVARG